MSEATFGVLERVAEVAGEDVALRLIKTFGGRRVFLPHEVPAGHPLADALGLTAARAVCKELGHGHLDVPRGTRYDYDRKYERFLEIEEGEDRTTHEVAQMLDVHVRTVRRWRRVKRGLPPR